MEYIAILGRQHDLAIAELESLYGAAAVMPINNSACFVDQKLDFPRIGSSIKQAKYIETLRTTNPAEAIEAALPFIVDARQHRQGKLQLGISVYGGRFPANLINRSALSLKKKLRSKGMSLRLIPNKQQELNAAQILRNKLTKENGFELNLIIDGDKIHLAKTLDVQDIDEYARRDREKPVRDSLVGMLPPKLAQTLINLTGAQAGSTLLDPFCGTGTVLMEAFQMNINSHGSDISPDMVEATRVNMNWFVGSKKNPTYDVELADACVHDWQQPIDQVAGETYLGPALRSLPDEKVLPRIIDEVNDIHLRFMQNLSAQLKSGTRVVLAVPAWHKSGKFISLPMLDDLEKLGYNPLSFVHVSDQLVYHRPQQVVGRRILSLIRK